MIPNREENLGRRNRMAELDAQQERLDEELGTVEAERNQRLTEWANEAEQLGVHEVIGLLRPVLARKGFEIAYDGLDSQRVAEKITAFLRQQEEEEFQFTVDDKWQRASEWGCVVQDIEKTLEARFRKVPGKRIGWGLR